MNHTQDWQNKSLQEVIEEFIEECIKYQYTQEKLIQPISISEPLKLKGINLAEKLAERFDDVETNAIGAIRAEIYSRFNQLEAQTSEQFNQLNKQLEETKKLHKEFDIRLEKIEDKLDEIIKLIKKDEEALNWFCVHTIPRIEDITGHRGLAIEPDRRILVVITDDRSKIELHRIKVWDLNSGEQIYTLAIDNGTYNPTISPDGKTFIINNFFKGVKQWNLSSGKEICTLPELRHSYFTFSPDSRTLVGSFDNGLIVWDLENKIEKRIILTNKVSDFPYKRITFSSDGRNLALFTSSYEESVEKESVEIVNVDTQEVVCILEHSRRTQEVVFSPDGSLLAGLSYGTISFWNTSSGSKVFSLTSECEFEGESYSYSAIAFCPHTRIFAAGCCNKIELWDLDSKKKLQTLTGHSGMISALCFDKNGKSLISYVGSHREVKIWQSA